MGGCEHRLAVQSSPPTQTDRRSANPLLNHENVASIGRRAKPIIAACEAWGRNRLRGHGERNRRRRPSTTHPHSREALSSSSAEQSLPATGPRPLGPPSTTTTATVQDPSRSRKPSPRCRFLGQQTQTQTACLHLDSCSCLLFPCCLFIGTDADIIFDDGIFVCCFFNDCWHRVLILLAETKQNEWKKSIKTA